MDSNPTIYVCPYLLKEVQQVLQNSRFAGVDAVAVQLHCDLPPRQLLTLQSSPVTDTNQSVVLGGGCLSCLDKDYSNLNLYIPNTELCFEMLIEPNDLHEYINQGAHIFTPSMLDDWDKINEQWQFKDTERKDFFRQSSNKLVLLDTGVVETAPEKFKKLADSLDIAFEVRPVSLDRLEFILLQYLFDWQALKLLDKDKRLADYAMINELLSQMVLFFDESQVIEQVLETFHMFCAASNVIYLSLDDAHQGNLFSLNPVDNSEEFIHRLQQQIEEYRLESNGFHLLVKRDEKILGIVAVDEVAFPQYLNHYLNLARNIVPVIALAINNARIYQKQLAAEREIRSLNAALANQLDSVNALNKELEAFTYSVSHDLKGPLRSLDGFSNILVRDYPQQLDERGQGFLERIRANAQRMGELIDDLLRLSRLTRAELKVKTLDLSAMANEISQDLLQSEPTRKCQFSIAENLSSQGDYSLVKAVLENLIGNAWKYTGKCQQAEIKIEQTLINGQSCFYIQDNGAGFDMELADKLFAPFQRLHSATDFPGSGIGLATVQRIIQRHRGKIWAESEPDRGASFYFTLRTRETIDGT